MYANESDCVADSDSSSSTETDVEDDKGEKAAAGREKGSGEYLAYLLMWRADSLGGELTL